MALCVWLLFKVFNVFKVFVNVVASISTSIIFIPEYIPLCRYVTFFCPDRHLGAGYRGRWGMTTSGHGVSFWGVENVLELDSVNGCTT